MATGSDLDLALKLKTEGFAEGERALEDLADAAKATGTAAGSAADGIGALGDAADGVGDAAGRADAGVEALAESARRAESAADGATGEVEVLADAAQSTGTAARQAGDGVEELAEAAESVGDAAGTAAVETKNLSAGTKKAGEEAKGAKKPVDDLAGTFGVLKNALASVASALAVVTLAQLADAYSGVQTRVGLVTDGTQAYGEALEEVRGIADDTRSDLTATADLYASLARTLDDLGNSTTTAGALTTTTAQAMRLSGASAEAADAALTQFVQGLNNGALRGEEFNSVMEQAPRLARALADGLGVTVGELRAMAEAGKLTADVLVNALSGQAATIAAEFATIPARFDDAMTRLRNSVTVFVGELNTASGASRAFSLGIDVLIAGVEVLRAILVPLASLVGAVPPELLATAAAAWILHAAWVPLTALATALAGAITTLVLGTLSRSILVWGQTAAAVGTLTTALRALWVVMLANPLTALLALLGGAAAAFYLFRDSAEESAAALREQREAMQGQVEEVEALVDAMARAKPGSDAYNEAARRLAEIVPGLTLSLSSQGTMIAELGAGYEENAAALAAWRAEQERATQALQVQELAVAAQQWRDASGAVDDHARHMREMYGESEATRTGLQSLTVALASWGGKLQADNQAALELNGTLREQGGRFRELALATFDATGSVDGVAQALRDVGASDDVIAAVTAELERMFGVSDQALDGLTDAQRRAAEAGLAAARALSGTIGEVDQVITGLDERIATHAKDLDAALKREAEGWKAVGEAARGTYDAAIEEAERYAQARRDALAGSTASEAERARQSIAIERDAAAAKLAALQDYQRQTLRLLDEEGRRRIEAARASGGDVRAAELEVLKIKRDTLRSIEADYRRHIDTLNAESRRHLDEVKRIEDEIRGLKMSTEDRIRELERGAMSDVDAYYDARKQAAEKAADAERAILEGNFELAKDLAQQSADIQARLASAVTDDNGNEVISKNRAIAESVEGVGKAAEIERRAMEGQAEAIKAKADASAQAARDGEQALSGLADEADRTADALDREVTLKLGVDRESVDALVETIRPLVEERDYLLKMRADLDTVRTALADVQSYAEDNPIPIGLTLGAADALLNDLQGHLDAIKDESGVELDLGIGPALSAIEQVESRMRGIGDTDATLTIRPNDSQVQATLNRLRQGTQSTHTIYVRTVQQNAAGGLIRRYATGGPVFDAPHWDVVPGTGNTDSVPAGLRPGSFVLRKRATAYYGDLLKRFATGGPVPSMLMPGERLFAPETVGRWGQGLFESLNAMTIPREQLAAALGGLTAPVARFAAGGPVPGAANPAFAAPAARETVDINLRLSGREVRLNGARDQAAALAAALRELARGG
jgi:tape measure domain-containing protein